MAEEPVTEAPESTIDVQEPVTEAPEPAVKVHKPVEGATESILEAGGDNSSAQDMEFVTENLPELTHADGSEATHNGACEPNSKRDREKGQEGEEEENTAAVKQKVDKSMEEEMFEKVEGSEKGGDYESPVEVKLGPKTFGSSLDMFNYFYKFLHTWGPNLNVNKYEHMVLLDLLKKGHLEPDKKIGKGISSFQVRYHPYFKSRCFFIIREDGSDDDFSFRKCVDHILPLPENMQIKPDVNKRLGGRGRGGGGGRRGWHGRGRGRGGMSRN